MRWEPHVRFGGRAEETGRLKTGTAPRPDPYQTVPTPNSHSGRWRTLQLTLNGRNG